MKGTLKRYIMLVFGSGNAYAIKKYRNVNDCNRPNLHFHSLPLKSQRKVVSVWNLGCFTSLSNSLTVE